MKTIEINNTVINIEGVDLVRKSGYGSYLLVVWVRNTETTEGDELKEITHDSQLFDDYQDQEYSDRENWLYEKCQYKIERMIEDWYSEQ